VLHAELINPSKATNHYIPLRYVFSLLSLTSLLWKGRYFWYLYIAVEMEVSQKGFAEANDERSSVRQQARPPAGSGGVGTSFDISAHLRHFRNSQQLRANCPEGALKAPLPSNFSN
jgi:hypothetical protein